MKMLVEAILSASLMLMASGSLFAQQSIQYAVSDAAKIELDVFGHDSGSTYDFSCPPMHTIGTIDVATNGHYVTGLRFGCSELLENGGMSYGLIMQQQLGYPYIFGSNEASVSYQDCYPLQWTGIHGRTGLWVDQLGAYCGTIDDVMAGRHDPNETWGAAGGNGGAANESECSAGHVPTGAKVTVLSGGNYIEGVELVCSKIYRSPNRVGELGYLDLSANDGINPATGSSWQIGDQYRLAFVTSYGRSANSDDISTYNTFVQNLAIDAGHGAADWRAVASTASVAAKDNTSTDPSVHGNNIPIFSIDGITKIADSYSDLWDGTVDAHITMDENGNSKLGQVFGGTENNGTPRSNGRVLGGSSESPPRVTIGNTNAGLNRWMVQYNAQATSSISFYALSEVLTVTAIQDDTAPVIHFAPYLDTISVAKGSAVSYPEVRCSDELDLRPSISAGAEINTGQAGLYTRTYTCQDRAGNSTSRDFTVAVYESDYGTRVEEIYKEVTGEVLSAGNIQAIRAYSSQFESGILTCTDLVDEFVALANLESAEPYYFECETEESRRSGELMAEICPEGLYSNCPLTKEYGQFVSFSDDSLSVDIDRGVLWWRFWTGVGATVTANDAKCLNPDDGFLPEINCFVNGEPNEDAIHPIITQDIATAAAEGLGGSGFGLYSVPKLFEYYTWYYTHNERCRLVGNDLDPCEVDEYDSDQSRPGYTPVLFPPNFSLSNAVANGGRVDAIDMGNEPCWQNRNAGYWPSGEGCIAGLQNSISTPHQVRIRGVRFSDEYAGLPDNQKDWEWGFYTDNKHRHMMTVYDGAPNNGFSSDFGINQCYIDTVIEDFKRYVIEGVGSPSSIAANFEPNYFCSFTQEEYESLVETKLNLDDLEREAMAQAFFDAFFGVATTVVSGGSSTAAKSAAASVRLGKILKAVSNTVEGIDTVLELATLAAEIYVFATEQVQECRQESGAERTSCFFQATGPTLIGLAGDRFLSSVAGGELLDTLTKKVPNPIDDLSVDVPSDIDSGLGPKDFQIQISNTRKRAQVESGAIDEHHQNWVGQDQGEEVEIEVVLNQLRSNQQGAEAASLNKALWTAYQSETLKSIERFNAVVESGISEVADGSLDVDTLINYITNWNRFIEELESGSAAIDRATILDDSYLINEMDERARRSEGENAEDWIDQYKKNYELSSPVCSL